MKTKEQKESFIKISGEDLKRIMKLNNRHKNLYLYLCSKATFQHRLFGIYKRESYSTLRNGVNATSDLEEFSDITAIKRACQKLEKLNIIKIINVKDNLIISLDSGAQIELISHIIKQDYKSFNLSLKRISEIRELFELDFSYFVLQYSKSRENFNLKEIEEAANIFS